VNEVPQDREMSEEDGLTATESLRSERTGEQIVNELDEEPQRRQERPLIGARSRGISIQVLYLTN
jgi:hypothetical protein